MKRFIAYGVVATVALAVASLASTTTAQAAENPNCNNVKIDTFDPVITGFTRITIAPGTTGAQTINLTRTNTVESKITNSMGPEISASLEAGVFVKFSASVKTNFGYSTVQTKASTDSTSTTTTWNFNQPGTYGVYTGTYKATGTCSTGSGNGSGFRDGNGSGGGFRNGNGSTAGSGNDSGSGFRSGAPAPSQAERGGSGYRSGADGSVGRTIVSSRPDYGLVNSSETYNIVSFTPTSTGTISCSQPITNTKSVEYQAWQMLGC